MKRIGEVIAIQEPEITIEFYGSGSDCVVGMIVSTEDGNKFGIVHTIHSVLIEEGKVGQAFGSEQSTDEQLKQDFPHLKNSLRLLAKAYTWHQDNSPLLLNQGVYSNNQPELLNKREYWQTVKLLPLPALERHIAWLRTEDDQFNDDIYLEKLSSMSRPLAWEIFLHQENKRG
ncbi:MAG: hypothetical protein A2V81_04195 [Candidatus Abawacabacteria bacterium RBG_16_42_10]|uniref:Uncharacterized protein n=1 Tax=Candidatus Abawacabacteria bacterium RBG_16_42_10 TaxID=1817814 RepID=A0A1F4XI73_9BACT|nr:MAG: hypothetical protein A2V81_04195 [Candidatus Abawacabacteria bacterium RBG_16_42_10]